jgi:predicted nuclease of predicted toxin-antitoxin system
MKIKIDECIDTRLQAILNEAGYESVTVAQQSLSAIDDESLYKLCLKEGYILLTLDSHFSNILRYDPKPTPGIIVLRGPNDLFPTIRILINTLIKALRSESPEGKLWVVEIGRIRIHEEKI